MDTYNPSRKPSKLNEQDMLGPAGEVSASSKAIFPVDPPDTDEQGLGDLLKPTYKSSVRLQGVAWKTHRKQWTI